MWEPGTSQNEIAKYRLAARVGSRLYVIPGYSVVQYWPKTEDVVQVPVMAFRDYWSADAIHSEGGLWITEGLIVTNGQFCVDGAQTGPEGEYFVCYLRPDQHIDDPVIRELITRHREQCERYGGEE